MGSYTSRERQTSHIAKTSCSNYNMNSYFAHSEPLFKGKGSFYIAQYPVRWIAQRSLHFLPSLADLFIPTPTRLLREAF